MEKAERKIGKSSMLQKGTEREEEQMEERIRGKD
jgi:hypothetical protein